MIRRPPRPTRTDTLFPYTALFLSVADHRAGLADGGDRHPAGILAVLPRPRRSEPDVLGLYDRRRPHGDPSGVVADGLPRPRHPADRAGAQPRRRRPE